MLLTDIYFLHVVASCKQLSRRPPTLMTFDDISSLSPPRFICPTFIPCRSHDPRIIVLFSFSAFFFTVGACYIKNVHAHDFTCPSVYRTHTDLLDPLLGQRLCLMVCLAVQEYLWAVGAVARMGK